MGFLNGFLLGQASNNTGGNSSDSSDGSGCIAFIVVIGIYISVKLGIWLYQSVGNVVGQGNRDSFVKALFDSPIFYNYKLESTFGINGAWGKFGISVLGIFLGFLIPVILAVIIKSFFYWLKNKVFIFLVNGVIVFLFISIFPSTFWNVLKAFIYFWNVPL